MPRKADVYHAPRLRLARSAWWLALAIGSCFASSASAAVVKFPLRLSPPSLTNGTVQLTFDGEAGVEYVAEGLTNLQTWIPLTTNSDPQITRVLDLGPVADVGIFRVTRKQLPEFSAALAATNGIDFNGWNVDTDSFDSADPLFSDNGLYPSGSPEKQKDNGHVVTNGGITNSSPTGAQRIKGRIRTGPTGLIGLGENSYVGSKSWVESNNHGIQPGYGLADMNVPYPVPTLPVSFNPIGPIVSGIVNGVFYNRILSSGDYWLANIGGSSGINKIYVAGDARLLIMSSISMTGGSDVIRIAPNASLKLYMQGANASLGGQGIVNENGNAMAFYYFGLAGNRNINFPANNSFTGIIHAPGADFSLGAGGTNTYDFIGASISKSLKLNGNCYFHFDEALLHIGPMR